MCYNCFTAGAYLLYRIYIYMNILFFLSTYRCIYLVGDSAKGFQLYVFEAGLTLKKSHQLFFSRCNTQEVAIFGKVWVLGGTWYMCSFEANLGICMLCSPGPTEKTTTYSFISLSNKKNSRK